ncbi:MAG: hypothetical protein M1480_10955 [Bacteroidetes bacterium]|nr:hypothetical protein [Bacteroidota bacterium]
MKNFWLLKFTYLFTGLFLLFFTNNFAQKIVDKNKGNYAYTKMGMMDGNLVQTVFYNFGEIADWQNQPTLSGVWPKGTNHTYVDGVAVIVQAEAKDNKGNVFHPLETNYYEYTRYNPATGITYGWWPLPGYANPNQSSVARSDDQTTWPTTWPDRPSDWNGQWDGFFGKGIRNADLESYFVFDDNMDRDYINKYKFYPDADDTTRGGLAMQVHGRGFQWSQVLAEDVIFWYYEITNMGTTDYPKSLFAQYVDWGIGGHDNSSNNAGDYDQTLNISYSWSTVAYGSPGHWSPVGYAGYAFLESPGIDYDNIDNDHDGMIDETRDDPAETWPRYPQLHGPIFEATSPYASKLEKLYNVHPVAPGGVKAAFIATHDTSLFLSYFNYQSLDDVPAIKNLLWWPGDENGNWNPEHDDVGSDGLGPFSPNYPGPDPDGTEGNLKPDQGEPDFGILDKDESDQLGLTGFAIFAVHKYDLNNDERNWEALSALPSPHGQSLVGVNLGNFFSSYLFHMDGRNTYSMQQGQLEETGATERFSMALLFGIDQNDLFRRKKTIQSIYNATYNFAKPPDKPIVTAIPGDHKVILYWDSRAEHTFDAFYQRINFEGYRIYRSTEPNFIEDQVITDAYGKATFRKPIAQFDLKDGVTGLFPINVNGAMFDLGNDTGLQHSFIDTNVVNGQTYYYAVVAYDKGFITTNIAGQVEGIPPSETTAIIKVDINGKVTTDVNTAVITPTAPSAGYVPPDVSNYNASGPGTGSLNINVLNPDSVKNFNTYRVVFKENTPFHDNPNPSYALINFSTGDTLIPYTQFDGSQLQTSVVEGLSLGLINDTSITVDQANTGWKTGSSNYITQVGFDSRYAASYQGQHVNFPADFEIQFTEPGKGDTSYPATVFSQPEVTNIFVKDITDNIPHMQFIFQDLNNNGLLDAGDAIFIIAGDSLGARVTSNLNRHVGWSFTLLMDTSIASANQKPPQPGDVFKIVTTKPFRNGEYFQFTTKSAYFDKSKFMQDLNDVAVVPNPYAAAASWEPTSQQVGRGERRVYFIHLPAKCTIRIYTISGNLVQTIYHNSNLTNGQEPWDLVSKDGMDIAFGVYIFQVDAGSLGQKIGRFAIIK